MHSHCHVPPSSPCNKGQPVAVLGTLAIIGLLCHSWLCYSELTSLHYQHMHPLPHVHSKCYAGVDANFITACQNFSDMYSGKVEATHSIHQYRQTIYERP